MPRFFFHVLDGSVFVDDDGEELPSTESGGLMPSGLRTSLRNPVSMGSSRSRCWPGTKRTPTGFGSSLQSLHRVPSGATEPALGPTLRRARGVRRGWLACPVR
jgi:hypothetical protein